MIDLFFRVDNERVGVSPALIRETCFHIGGGRKTATSLCQELDKPVTSVLSIGTFLQWSVVGALKATPQSLRSRLPLLLLFLLLLLLRLPNATHTTLQSSSSCSPHPRLIDFLFPCIFPLLLSSSPSIFCSTFPAVQLVSPLSFPTLPWSTRRFSPTLTRSKPQPCSEMLKVCKWRCNAIERSGNRIHEGRLWSC